MRFCCPAIAASLLRFYWFRLADVAVPLGVAITSVSTVCWHSQRWPRLARAALAALALLAVYNLVWYGCKRAVPQQPRADKWVRYADWRDVCDWIAHAGVIPPKARFLTPRGAQTFKWYTGRAEVVTWKEIPQDATSILAWRRRLEDIYGPRSEDVGSCWVRPLICQGTQRLRQLGKKYQADFLLTRLPQEEPVPEVALELLYANSSYAVYRLDGRGSAGAHVP